MSTDRIATCLTGWAWQERIVADGARAARHQTASQREITMTVMARAVELGAQGFALTGSSARGSGTLIEATCEIGVRCP